MMNLEAAADRVPLVLLVDSAVSSRHALWRTLHRTFGVLEADSTASAHTWLGRRPDIDALVVHGDLADGPGEDLAREWIDLHPAIKRPVILATPPTPPGERDLAVAHGLVRVEIGDLRGVVEGLATWLSSLSSRNSGLARLLLREADRLLV
jgi:response regulator RpfG family c-di-GMP phosphodiesterase